MLLTQKISSAWKKLVTRVSATYLFVLLPRPCRVTIAALVAHSRIQSGFRCVVRPTCFYSIGGPFEKGKSALFLFLEGLPLLEYLYSCLVKSIPSWNSIFQDSNVYDQLFPHFQCQSTQSILVNHSWDPNFLQGKRLICKQWGHINDPSCDMVHG